MMVQENIKRYRGPRTLHKREEVLDIRVKKINIMETFDPDSIRVHVLRYKSLL